jgi:hypothetical protein
MSPTIDLSTMKAIIDNLLYVSPNRGLLYVTDLEVEYPYVPQGAEDDVINPDGSTKVDESECFSLVSPA